MPLKLAEPKQSVAIDEARVAAIHIENNPFKGTQWIDIYVVLGREVDGVWQQYVDPISEAIAQYYRITPGCNPHARPTFFGHGPLGDGVALGKCNVCGVWHPIKSGPCSEEGCEGTVEPYDGFQRLVSLVPVGDTIYDAIKNAVYAFLTSEQVPDPLTGEIRPLLAATE